MAFIRQSELLGAYRRRYGYLGKTADRILKESADQFSSTKTYDIFLSHASLDRQLVLGLKAILEEKGYSVYVDWLEDTQLDRSRVTAATAEVLRIRMNSCRSLLFAATQNASQSKWMPWEHGYFDGLKRGLIGIVPLVTDTDSNFNGLEYLAMYPVVQSVPEKNDLGIIRDTQPYTSLKDFAAGSPQRIQYR